MTFTITNMYNCSQHYMLYFDLCIIWMHFAVNRWNYWKSSEFNESKKHPLHGNIHGIPAITGMFLKLVKTCHIITHSQCLGIFLRMNNILITLQVISETPISDQSVGRSLLQAVEPPVKPPIMFNVSGGPCIMLWAQNLTVRLGPSSPWIDLAQGEPSFVGSLCNGRTSR